MIDHALQGAALIDEKSLSKLSILEYSALEAMTKGMGTKDDWHTLAGCLNVCETMAQSGIGVEVKEVCERVQKHLQDAAIRFKTTGKMGLTGLGIKDIRELLEYADLQRRSISRSEFEKMITKTSRMIMAMQNVVTV